MGLQVIVVEDLTDIPPDFTDAPVVHVDDYLTGSEFFKRRDVQVINLCRSYRYLSVGYYCSLLAEARRHRVIPSIRSMLDLSSKSMYRLDAVNLDAVIQKSLQRERGAENAQEFELDIRFGRCDYPALGDLARQLFETFPFPLLRVRFARQSKWYIAGIDSPSPRRLSGAERQCLAEAFAAWRGRRWRGKRRRTPARYDLAILYDRDDPLPPSDEKAIDRFIKAGRELALEVEVIGKGDYSRLPEYDALFIRDTTRIRHYTYRFAKRAESEDMVVIDDPQSILRCTNKVYLAELLRAHRVRTPRTVIVGRADLDAAESALGYPMVLKLPEGSFSQGVFKANDRSEMEDIAGRLFKTSELILAQEFLYTEFDWRIGVLNRQPLYASQYFMSKRHWQIVKYDAEGGFKEGAFRTLAIESVPEEVVKTAVRASNLIGDGLYGVDLKQTERGVVVIEVNDNPSLDAGVEDRMLKGELYRRVMAEFVRRIERLRFESGRASH